jgi:hypothetical protein
MNIYRNEYSYVDNGVYKTGKIAGTFSPGSNPYVQESFVSSLFTPSVSGSWSKDALALKFKLNLLLIFSGRKQDSLTVDDSGKLIYNGESSLTFTFTFRPDLRLALQYKIISNRLILNTGARIQATAITRETVNLEYYTNNVRDAGQRIHRNSFTNPAASTQFVSRFSVGTTFNFREEFYHEPRTFGTHMNNDKIWSKSLWS